MSDITLSRSVRANLVALQSTSELIATTQTRLATGKKVNSALDNPNNFFTAASLNARANDLSSLLDGISNATKTIEAADKGITSIKKLIESAQSTANQARQDSSPASVATITSSAVAGATTKAEAAGKLLVGTEGTTGMGLTAGDVIRISSTNTSTGVSQQFDLAVTASMTVQDLVDQVNASGAAIATINNDGTFKMEAKDNNTSLSVQASATGTFTNDVERVAKVLGSGTDNSVAAASASKTTATFTLGDIGGGDATSATTLSSLGITNGSTLTFKVTNNDGNVSTQTLAVVTATTIANLVSAFNGIGGTTVTDNTGVAADTVTFTGAADTKKIELSVSGTGLTDATIAGNLGGLRTDASLASVTDGGGAAASDARKKLASQFNELRTQIDKLAQDSGFNGINLLNGDNLKVVFNEKTGTAQSSLTINGSKFDSTSLGIKDGSSASSGYNNFASNGDVDNALENLSTALTTLRTQSSTFGSNLSIVQARQDFTKNIVNTLKSGADNLVLADTNEEGANLLALQTRQTLSTTALSLASQADQNVLRLF